MNQHVLYFLSKFPTTACFPHHSSPFSTLQLHHEPSLSTISQRVKQQPRPCESQGTPNMLKRRNSLTSWVVVSPRKRPFTSTSMYKPDLGRRLPNASQFRSVGKESACDVGDPSSIPGSGRSLEEGKATHSSILAWRIPWPNLRTYKNSEPTRFDGI